MFLFIAKYTFVLQIKDCTFKFNVKMLIAFDICNNKSLFVIKKFVKLFRVQLITLRTFCLK